MKTKVLPCLAALTGLLSAEPARIVDLKQISNIGFISYAEPNGSARMAVMMQIVSRLQKSQMPPFSRAMPVGPLSIFQPVELVDGEERLPFAVQTLGIGVEVAGYVRIADNAIFISRPEKKDHIRSTLDPRFAPPEEAKSEAEDPA